jgi:hypothetical protein
MGKLEKQPGMPRVISVTLSSSSVGQDAVLGQLIMACGL